jgi:phosphonopyruvate decarboxylase
MLENIDVPTCILPNYIEGANAEIEKAVQYIKSNSSPYGFIVKRNTFGDYEKKTKVVSPYPLNREDAIKCLLKYMGPHEPIVSTTGFTSRELYEVREKMNAGGRDFLCVGSMGHASSIAMGIALAKPSKKVYCFDGDGAVLMHMGSLAVVGNSTMDNFIHIVFNNGAHESVGGQPTVSQKIDISKIAKACGYKEAFKVSTEAEIKSAIEKCHSTHGPTMIEILSKIGTRKNLGRPKSSTYSNKNEFMKFLDE